MNQTFRHAQLRELAALPGMGMLAAWLEAQEPPDQTTGKDYHHESPQ